MAAKMKMVMKGGKSVPAFAADGKGKMQMGGVKKYQKGGSTTKKKVDNSITGKMQRGLDYILGSDKLRATGVATNNALKPYADKTRTALNKVLRPASPKVLMAKKQYGGSKKMQYGGSSMSLGPVTDFKQIPRPASTTTTTPAATAAPAPTSVKEAREQARIAKINAKAKGYADGTIVPGQNTGRLIDAGVEGARLVNNAMESRRNPGGMKKGGATKKYQKGGGIPITAKAADRKVAKGKGTMTYKYGNMDAPGTGNNKGSYVKFGKDKESGLIGGVQFKSMKGKARPVKKMGGVIKKK